MSYQKQNFVPGQRLKASEVNHMEDGIATADDKAEAARNALMAYIGQSEAAKSGVMATIESNYAPPYVKQLRIYGQSTQDGIPDPSNPVPIHSKGDSGSIKLISTGKNMVDTSDKYGEQEIWFGIDTILVAGVTYTLSVKTSIDPTNVYVSDSSGNSVVYKYNVNTLTFSVNETGLYKFHVYRNEYTSSEDLQWAMLNEGDTALPYEPYRATTATLTTGLPLHGIPVSSGGNVTIDGQQYIADYVEKFADGTGRVVKNVYRKVLTGDENISKAHVDWITGEYCFSIAIGCTVGKTSHNLLCAAWSNYFKPNTGDDVVSAVTQYGVIIAFAGGVTVDVTMLNTSGINTVESLRTWLRDKYNSGDPVRVYVNLETPEIIPLTAEEMAELEAMETYKPVTNIFNDARAHMELVYSTEQTAANDRNQAEIARLKAALA